MDFLDVLKERVKQLCLYYENDEEIIQNNPEPYIPLLITNVVEKTINATIEALKEMMVGQPCIMRLEHFGDGMLLIDQNDEVHGSYPFTYSIPDGEEVIRVVFRNDKEK